MLKILSLKFKYYEKKFLSCFNNFMKVSAITNNYFTNNNKANTDRPNFTGLTKLMKRQIYIDGKKDILNLIEKRRPEQSTIVGQLPGGIFENLPKDKPKRINAIKEIMNVFGDIAEEIRGFKCGVNSTNTEYKNRRSDSTVQKLREVFNKYNLNNTKDDIDLEFLGKGDYGSAFRIRGIHDNKTNDDYILKIHTVADRGPNWHRYKSHGNFAEPNTAEYWLNLWGEQTQRGKFYFADINKGYMVDNYIDSNTPPYKKKVNEYTAGLKLTDEELAHNGHNKINGYSIDWGGVRVVNRVKNGSKTARTILHKIKRTPKNYREIEWWKIFEDKKHFDDIQKKAGLALSIKHIADDRKNLYINKCLNLRIPMVDQALGYVLKYLPHDVALKYFEKLMSRNDEITQTILMNEIPLLARKPVPEAYDDMNVPKDQIIPEKVEEFYKIAKHYAIPQTREHLASYVHLLTRENIENEFKYLVELDDYNVYDRLLHKIRIVPEEEFPFDLKFKMLDTLEKVVKHPYLQRHTQEIKILTLRKTLED